MPELALYAAGVIVACLTAVLVSFIAVFLKVGGIDDLPQATFLAIFLLILAPLSWLAVFVMLYLLSVALLWKLGSLAWRGYRKRWGPVTPDASYSVTGEDGSYLGELEHYKD